jgi:hypothetical protein
MQTFMSASTQVDSVQLNGVRRNIAAAPRESNPYGLGLAGAAPGGIGQHGLRTG